LRGRIEGRFNIWTLKGCERHDRTSADGGLVLQGGQNHIATLVDSDLSEGNYTGFAAPRVVVGRRYLVEFANKCRKPVFTRRKDCGFHHERVCVSEKLAESLSNLVVHRLEMSGYLEGVTDYRPILVAQQRQQNGVIDTLVASQSSNGQ